MTFVTCCDCECQFIWNGYLTDEILNRPSREVVVKIDYSKYKIKVMCCGCSVIQISKCGNKIRHDIKLNGG
jgi:hypothetical protein